MMGMIKSDNSAATVPSQPSSEAHVHLPSTSTDTASPDSIVEKGKTRRVFAFVSKKQSDSSQSQSQSQASSTPTATTTTTTITPPAQASFTASDNPRRSTTMTSPPPSQNDYLLSHSQMSPPIPSSPSRGLSSSPRLVSPAGSQIFERDVQDSVVLPPTSPAIPSHIKTENHIPPVLDASSEAITDQQLDPNSVEIITTSSHQPAGAAFASSGAATPHPLSPAEATWDDELAASYVGSAASAHDRDDSASNYGSIDTTDVRRLSFISFADVVLSEQSGYGGGPSASRESIHMAGLTSLSSHRSPSPIRSPVSSQGPGTSSPPTSSPSSIKGVELSPQRSPQRKPIGSPTLPHPTLILGNTGQELNIETMSQALRRTGSTDLGPFRSTPASPTEGHSH